MKLEDVILVVERTDTGKKACLFTLEDFVGRMEGELKDIHDMAVLMAELFKGKSDTQSFCGTVCSVAQRTVTAKFCCLEGELRGFLKEMAEADYPAGHEALDIDRCSMECLEVLKAYNISMTGGMLSHRQHYEAIEHTFRAGEAVNNFNGSKYLVLEVLSEENLLLRNIKTNETIVAVGAKYYNRYPAEQEPSAGRKGMEWNHGVYLGHDVSDINYQGIRKSYGRAVQMDNPEDCRREALHLFREVQNICQNEWFPVEMQSRMEQVLEELFGTDREETFMDNLHDGCYDVPVQSRDEWGKEKAR